MIKWLNDGKSYATSRTLGGDSLHSVVILDILKGEVIDTSYFAGGEAGRVIFSDFTYSPDEKYLLFPVSPEKIYRGSFKAEYQLLDIEGEKLYTLSNGSPIANVTFSPNSKLVAYTRDNDLYFTRLDNFEEYAITKTGVEGQLINGRADWVYEEELGMTRAYEWSPDSKMIAYLSFNESKVENYQIQI